MSALLRSRDSTYCPPFETFQISPNLNFFLFFVDINHFDYRSEEDPEEEYDEEV